MLSLALHAAVLAGLLLLRPVLHHRPDPPTISMRLVTPPASDPTIKRPAPRERQPERRPEAAPETGPALPAGEPSGDPPEASPDGDASSDRQRAATPSPGIAARILDQIAVREHPAEDRDDAAPAWPASDAAAPGVPGRRGWLSHLVGGVATSSDRWRANDGSRRARYVMADGTVVCTHRRAPTIDELMNPWKSVAVTMAYACGRERPQPPDFSDPRVQAPPGRASNPE